MKKVLLIVVDACASRVLVPALENGRLPNIRRLSQAGAMYPNSISIFPSITPAATSSIITGVYPYEHGVAGAHWYNPNEDTVVYYGPDFWVIVDKGLGDFFDDFLLRLNHDRLRAETLFETVERAGKRAACLNYLIFRGDVAHTIDMPLLLGLIPGAPFSEEVRGASILYWGDFVATEIEALGSTLKATGGPQNRFGFNDTATAELLVQLTQNNALPDFTLAYFPDNDFNSHDVGPANAVDTLEAVDEKLGQLIDVYGGVDALLDDLCILLTGDHSQTDVVDNEDTAGISLEDVLNEFTLATPGEPWTHEDELVVCPNLRTAQMYLHYPSSDLMNRLIEALLQDDRIDQVIWRATAIDSDERGLYVATRDRGRLHFWAGDDGPHTATDEYGGVWSWDGDLGAVDGYVSDDGRIECLEYPNAFERLAGGINPDHSGSVWVTARPGYEFHLKHTSLHVSGGSHGSLHRDDSTSPLLIAGAPEDIEVPATPRAVDVVPLVLHMLGITPAHEIGASHIYLEDIRH